MDVYSSDGARIPFTNFRGPKSSLNHVSTVLPATVLNSFSCATELASIHVLRNDSLNVSATELDFWSGSSTRKRMVRKTAFMKNTGPCDLFMSEIVRPVGCLFILTNVRNNSLSLLRARLDAWPTSPCCDLGFDILNLKFISCAA